jgi:hypothetical protein
MESLVATARAAGYMVEVAANDWITKEITLVLTEDMVRACRPRNQRGGRVFSDARSAAAGQDLATRSRAWLEDVVEVARQLGRGRDGFGIFGTANAATWLASVGDVNCRFFVDEDAHKVGKQHVGRPIYAPDTVPAEVPVLLVFPPAQADAVFARLETRAPHVSWRLPPAPAVSKA